MGDSYDGVVVDSVGTIDRDFYFEAISEGVLSS